MKMRFREINFDFQVRTLIRLVMYNGNIFYDKYEFPMTDSSTSYSCPRKRNLEVLESH